MGILVLLLLSSGVGGFPLGSATASAQPHPSDPAPGLIGWFGGTGELIPPRAFAAAASFYQGNDSYVLLDGGTGDCGRACDDSWLSYADVQGGPALYPAGQAGPGRMAPSMVFDPADSEFVLFGGWNTTLGALNDTWTFPTAGEIRGWQADPTSYEPPARWDASMVYDPATGAVYLFGGFGASGQPLGDTWVFQQGNWSQVDVPSAPPVRGGASWVWDAQENVSILFGGNGTAGSLGDTWAFSGTSWWELQPTTSPSPRANASASFDGPGDPILFGGTGPTGFLNDTWAFHQGNWTPVEDYEVNNPSPREGAIFVPDYTIFPYPNDFLLANGEGPQGFLPDDWNGYLYEVSGTPPVFPLGLRATGSPTAGTSSLTVQFHAYVSGGTPAYVLSWNFGDGTTGYGVDPDHTYLRPGSYVATVALQDSAVPPQTAEATISVTVNSPPGKFAVRITAVPASGPPPLAVQFSASTTGGAGPFTYAWSFGNGSAGSELASPTYTYGEFGDYAATVVVKDSVGDSANWTTSVVVGEGHFGLELTASPLQGSVPLLVSFRAQPTGGQAPDRYVWSFGDGQGIATPLSALSHQYNATGNFTVNVTVIDALGQSAEQSLVVQVVAAQVAPPPHYAGAGLVLHDLEVVAVLLATPAGLATILALLAMGSVYRWGLPAGRRVLAVKRALPPPALQDLWGVGVVAALVADLRGGAGLAAIRQHTLPLLRRDARRAADRLAWHPGPLALWSIRRALLLVPQFLIAETVLFLARDIGPDLLTYPQQAHNTPALPSVMSPGLYLTEWWNFVSGLWTAAGSNLYLRFFLPYTLQLLAVVVLLSVLMAYPLGLLAGWNRGRVLDQSSRVGSVLAMSIPIFVVALLVLGWLWKAYFDLTGGDTLLGALPNPSWFDVNGGYPSWIGSLGQTTPTGFSLVDAALHGAWNVEGVILLKIFVQGFAIAALYTAIFLRYARLATEELSYDLAVVGARSRGVPERSILWQHTSRRVAPLYIAIFGTTFPILLFVQFVAEWAFSDPGLGLAFFSGQSTGQVPPVAVIAFIILLLIFVVNAITDVLSRALSPGGLGEQR